jgi:hypothetical protein
MFLPDSCRRDDQFERVYFYHLNKLQKTEIVIPAEAGIQSFQELLDHRFRGGDTFY